jgi:hypothetical protein
MLCGKHYGGPVHCQGGGRHEVESTEYCTECLISVCREHSERAGVWRGLVLRLCRSGKRAVSRLHAVLGWGRSSL